MNLGLVKVFIHRLKQIMKDPAVNLTQQVWRYASLVYLGYMVN
jgi:hypothetical protein